MRRFDPRVPKKDGSLIWKEGEANYDATAKKQEIHQIIYIKTGNIIESFDHYVSLQLYDRNVLFDAFKELDSKRLVNIAVITLVQVII